MIHAGEGLALLPSSSGQSKCIRNNLSGFHTFHRQYPYLSMTWVFAAFSFSFISRALPSRIFSLLVSRSIIYRHQIKERAEDMWSDQVKRDNCRDREDNTGKYMHVTISRQIYNISLWSTYKHHNYLYVFRSTGIDRSSNGSQVGSIELNSVLRSS